MPNTTDYRFGDLVLVPFPFTDQTGTKKRPAVVVSSDTYQGQRPDVVLTLGELQEADRTALRQALVTILG